MWKNRDGNRKFIHTDVPLNRRIFNLKLLNIKLLCVGLQLRGI